MLHFQHLQQPWAWLIPGAVCKNQRVAKTAWKHQQCSSAARGKCSCTDVSCEHPQGNVGAPGPWDSSADSASLIRDGPSDLLQALAAPSHHLAWPWWARDGHRLLGRILLTTKAPWLVLMATSICRAAEHNLEGSLAIVTHGIFFSPRGLELGEKSSQAENKSLSLSHENT